MISLLVRLIEQFRGKRPKLARQTYRSWLREQRLDRTRCELLATDVPDSTGMIHSGFIDEYDPADNVQGDMTDYRAFLKKVPPEALAPFSKVKK